LALEAGLKNKAAPDFPGRSCFARKPDPKGAQRIYAKAALAPRERFKAASALMASTAT
jgi:hypothetical protein